MITAAEAHVITNEKHEAASDFYKELKEVELQIRSSAMAGRTHVAVTSVFLDREDYAMNMVPCLVKHGFTVEFDREYPGYYDISWE